jgi:hypothetical protein
MALPRIGRPQTWMFHGYHTIVEGAKCSLKNNATTAKTTTLFKHFINFIPLHTFFVMCQYSLGIDLSLGENLQVTIHLAAKYMSKPCKIFVQSCLGNPMETNISMKHQYFTFLEINDRLYTWPIICKKIAQYYIHTLFILNEQRPKPPIQVHPNCFIWK